MLRRLHPEWSEVLPLCPADAPQMVVDLGWMAQEMRASDTGAAPGLSGFRSNYISVLAADPHCVQALALLVQHIVNNALPPAIRTLLTTCLLVSLLKPGGNGRRPIAIGDAFYRMAARYALYRVTSAAQRILRPYQFGVGESDGCSQIVQSLQHLLEAPPRAPPLPWCCMRVRGSLKNEQPQC
jgi:hypothetical protein